MSAPRLAAASSHSSDRLGSCQILICSLVLQLLLPCARLAGGLFRASFTPSSSAPASVAGSSSSRTGFSPLAAPLTQHGAEDLLFQRCPSMTYRPPHQLCAPLLSPPSPVPAEIPGGGGSRAGSCRRSVTLRPGPSAQQAGREHGVRHCCGALGWAGAEAGGFAEPLPGQARAGCSGSELQPPGCHGPSQEGAAAALALVMAQRWAPRSPAAQRAGRQRGGGTPAACPQFGRCPPVWRAPVPGLLDPVMEGTSISEQARSPLLCLSFPT